jgi:hypothetical protein
MQELQFRREMDIGFVEGNEEEREDLVDFDKKDLGLLIEFWMRTCQSAIDE